MCSVVEPTVKPAVCIFIVALTAAFWLAAYHATVSVGVDLQVVVFTLTQSWNRSHKIKCLLEGMQRPFAESFYNMDRETFHLVPVARGNRTSAQKLRVLGYVPRCNGWYTYQAGRHRKNNRSSYWHWEIIDCKLSSESEPAVHIPAMNWFCRWKLLQVFDCEDLVGVDEDQVRMWSVDRWFLFLIF